jgi:DNA-binding MarR family transcriptional regulator
MTRWLTDEEQRLWRAYLEARTRLDAAVDAQLAECGLSTADFAVLVPLSEAPGAGLRARDLGLQAGWDRSRLSHQLRRMEQRGLLRRTSCPTDARGTVVELTEAGRAALVQAAPGHVETVRRHFVDLLAPADLPALTAALERVRDALPSAGCGPDEGPGETSAAGPADEPDPC